MRVSGTLERTAAVRRKSIYFLAFGIPRQP
jgi:hypothetical protein